MPVEKITPSVHREWFPVVRMWRDDLEEIVKLVREVVGGKEKLMLRVRDKSDEYSISEIADIATFKIPRLKQISIYAPSIRVRLDIGPKDPILEVEDPDLHVRGLLAEISRMIHAKARPLARLDRWIVDHLWFLILILLVAIPIGLINMLSGASLGAHDKTPGIAWQPAVVGLAFGTVLYYAVGWLYRLGKFNTSILHIKSKVEEPTFWSRKKDDLAITLVSSVLSLILGGIIGYWVNSIS